MWVRQSLTVTGRKPDKTLAASPAPWEQRAQGRCLLKGVPWLTRTCRTSNRQPLVTHRRHALTPAIIAPQSSSLSPQQCPNTTRPTALPLSLLSTWNYYSCSAVLRGFSPRKKGIAYSLSVWGTAPVPAAAWQWGAEGDPPSLPSISSNEKRAQLARGAGRL